MIGEVRALGCALCWALVPISPGTKAITQISSLPLLYLILSALIGIAAGDSLYFRGLKLINVTLAFPIAQSAMPVMTLCAAVLFLEEPITWFFALGTSRVLGGIYLIIAPEGKTQMLLRGRILEKKGIGISLVLVASVPGATSISLLKISLQEVNLVLANAIRLSIASLLLTFMILLQNPDGQPVRTEWRDISLGAITGILGFGVGRIFFFLLSRMQEWERLQS